MIAGWLGSSMLAAPDDNIPPGQGPEWGKAAPIGLLIILLLGLALFFLIKSMNKQFRKVPASFDPAATDQTAVEVDPAATDSTKVDPAAADSTAVDWADADPGDPDRSDADTDYKIPAESDPENPTAAAPAPASQRPAQ